MIRYWAIQEFGDTEPTGLFRVVSGDSGMPPEYLNTQGEWVRDPALEAFLNGEPGAKPISKEEARQIVEKWGRNAGRL